MSTDEGYRSLLMGVRKLVMYVAIWRPSATSVLPQILVAVNELGLLVGARRAPSGSWPPGRSHHGAPPGAPSAVIWL